jgi:hypothetical protein
VRNGSSPFPHECSDRLFSLAGLHRSPHTFQKLRVPIPKDIGKLGCPQYRVVPLGMHPSRNWQLPDIGQKDIFAKTQPCQVYSFRPRKPRIWNKISE